MKTQTHDQELEDLIHETWAVNPGIQAEFNGDFEAFKAYYRAKNAGLVKIAKRP
jgi:hypothetical protein